MHIKQEPNEPMYVCVCNAVTDHAIREAAAAGVDTICELTMRTGCGACCGSCVPYATRLLEESQQASAEAQQIPVAIAA